MLINTKPITQKRNVKSSRQNVKTKTVIHRVKAEPKLQEKSTTENGVVLPNEGYDGLSKVTVNVSGGGRTAEALSVTENGTINTPDGKYYNPITVNVSGGTVYGQKVRYLYAYKQIADSDTSIVYTTVEEIPTDNIYYMEYNSMADLLYENYASCLVEAPIIPGVTYTRVTEYDIDFGMEIATAISLSVSKDFNFVTIVSPKATPEIEDTIYLVKNGEGGFKYLEATEFTDDYTINSITGETVFEYKNALYAWADSESLDLRAYTPKRTPSVGDKVYYFSDYYTLSPRFVEAVSPDGSITVNNSGYEVTLEKFGSKDLKW